MKKQSQECVKMTFVKNRNLQNSLEVIYEIIYPDTIDSGGIYEKENGSYLCKSIFGSAKRK